MRRGFSSATAQAQTSLALLAAIKEALKGEPEVDVSLGFTWPPVSLDWVSVGDTESEIAPENIGPNRQLSERITITVNVGSWNPETSHEQRERTFSRAFQLLGMVQTHIRTTDIELGGTVLWCVPGRSSSQGATPEDRSQFGEYTEIQATFVAEHRISTTY